MQVEKDTRGAVAEDIRALAGADKGTARKDLYKAGRGLRRRQERAAVEASDIRRDRAVLCMRVPVAAAWVLDTHPDRRWVRRQGPAKRRARYSAAVRALRKSFVPCRSRRASDLLWAVQP